jgi:hypothetical protein
MQIGRYDNFDKINENRCEYVEISDGNTVVSLYKDNGKWHEGDVIEGDRPRNWGEKTYQGYLDPEDIATWLSKDYRGNWKVVLSESESWAKTKSGVLHVNLLDKYKESGDDKVYKEKFEEYKQKIDGFKDSSKTLGLEAGDVIEFTGGYNNDIRYTTEVLGFDKDDEIYLLWDSFWYPIRKEESRSIFKK